MTAQETYEKWAAQIEKPKVNFKDEIGALAAFHTFITCNNLRWEHPITRKRVRFDDLPDVFRKAIQHVWMWGTDEDKSRVKNDDPPRRDPAQEDSEDEEGEDHHKRQPAEEVGKMMARVESLEARDIKTLEDLKKCKDGTAPVIGVVRQPVLFINSRLPSVARSQLGRHRVVYIPIDRGIYFGLGACLMLGIWEGEVWEQLGYKKGTAIDSSDLLSALTMVASDSDHEPVFNWLRQQGLSPAAGFKRRGDTWYVPLMPVSFERSGGYVGEWEWPRERK